MSTLGTLFAAFTSSQLLFAAAALQAAPYPEGPVTVIVPFNPGGGTDQQARMIEQEFKNEFGQPLVFVYKTGASGSIGATELANSKPDGSTIAVYTFPLMVMNALTGIAQYDLNDFDYLAVASNDQVVLVTRKDSEYKTIGSFLDAARANPGRLSVGTVESTGPTQLAALALKDQGVDINVVPLAGGAKGLAAVLGGHVDALFALRGAVRTSASKLNFLAIATEKRHPELAEVPTLKEKAHDVVFEAARIWIAPKGLPESVHNRLVEGLRSIYSIDSVKAKQEKAGQPVEFADGAELKAMVMDFVPKAKALLGKLDTK